MKVFAGRVGETGFFQKAGFPENPVQKCLKGDETVEQDILNLDEAVVFLKTSKPTFYRWLGQGLIKGFKMGREWRFYKSDLISYMESSDQETEILRKELRRLNDFFAQRLQKKNVRCE